LTPAVIHVFFGMRICLRYFIIYAQTLEGEATNDIGRQKK